MGVLVDPDKPKVDEPIKSGEARCAVTVVGDRSVAGGRAKSVWSPVQAVVGRPKAKVWVCRVTSDLHTTLPEQLPSKETIAPPRLP